MGLPVEEAREIRENTEANGNNGSDAGNAGTSQGDIVIIDGGSTSGVTENGVPYTGEDLQDVIIQ